MKYAKIMDGMKVSKSGVESLSQGCLTWENLGVKGGLEDGLPPKKIKTGFKKAQKMADPASRLAMMCAEQLLQNLAGQRNLKQIDGIVLGSLLGCLLTDIRYFETAIPNQGSKASPLFFKNTLPSIPVGEICIAFKIKGPNTLVNTGEVSGISAIVQGAEWIDQGVVESCLVGGFDLDCQELRSHFSLPLPENEYASSAYFFVLGSTDAPESGPELARVTKHRTFFKPSRQKQFSCRFLGNMGMEELWTILKQKTSGKERLSLVSYDGHGAEIEIEMDTKVTI